MLYRPSQINPTDDKSLNLQNDTEKNPQHGIHQHHDQQQPVRHESADGTEHAQQRRSILLDVPPETLTSITSYLTPPALFSLGCVSSYLAHHVKEDNTWRRAYLCHFLGISPESDVELENPNKWAHGSLTSYGTSTRSWKTLLLRREEGRSWRDEFAWRYVMFGRWSRSRSTPTTHTPIIHSPISNIHLTNIPSASFSQASSNSVSRTTSSENQPTPYVYPSTRFGTPALLTASIQYGIVARSIPLSGRVLAGYLDASAGARLGVGGNLNFGIGGNLNGNPNAQFTPNVTACDLITSSPSSPVSSNTLPTPSARVVWGTRAGELIFSFAPRAMDGTLRASGGTGVQVRRCSLGDEHEGMVRDVRFIDVSASGGGSGEGKGRWAVSAGEDGRVKLWDAGIFAGVDANIQASEDEIKCIWSSDPMLVDRFGSRVVGVTAGGGVVPDRCVRAEASFSTTQGGIGVVAGVGESGDVRVWIGHTSAFGVGGDLDANNSNTRTKIKEVFIDCPFKTVDGAARRVTALHIQPISIHTWEKTKKVAFLVAYEDDPLFYRVRVDVGVRAEDHHEEESFEADVTPFGDPNFGPASVVMPYFGRKDASFVLVGDHIGCVSLYAWDTLSPASSSHSLSTSTSTSILPLRTFEAHRDGASVTALWWDGLVLVTGSARGTTHVWDAITFGHLRSFVSPVGRVRGRDRGQGRLAGGALALGPHGAAGGPWAAGAGVAAAGGREAVRHIVVNPERDLLVVSVGDTVMAWHAGVVGRGAAGGGKGGVRGRHAPGTGVHGKKRAGAGVAKYVGQYEMRQNIAESRDLLDAERKALRSSSLTLTRREVEHRAGLDSLGLSEVEAVEYVLMLSRDEAAAAAAERARTIEAEWEGGLDEEEGVFEGDFEESEDNEKDNDDMSLFGPSPSVSSGGSSTPSGSPSVSSSSSSLSSIRPRARGYGARLGMTIMNRGPARTPSGQPILGPSRSNEKVQISPPWRGGEPKQAGEEYFSDDHTDEGHFVDEMRDESAQEHHFPAIPGSAGTSPEDQKNTVKGKEREQEKKVSSPSASLVGKGKGKGQRKNMISKDGFEATVQTSPSATPLTSTFGGSPSPKSLKASAWSVPLKPKGDASAAGSSTSSFSAVAAAAAATPSPMRTGTPARSRISPPAVGRMYTGSEDDMDEDLRFALELSLVEARSRGEDV